jgi:predicted ATPase
MALGPQFAYLTEDLNPEIIRTPFQVRTNWRVITGAACTGKATLINQLAEQGYQTYPEAAREFFDREISGGKSLEELREDAFALQNGIHRCSWRKKAVYHLTSSLF